MFDRWMVQLFTSSFTFRYLCGLSFCIFSTLTVDAWLQLQNVWLGVYWAISNGVVWMYFLGMLLLEASHPFQFRNRHCCGWFNTFDKRIILSMIAVWGLFNMVTLGARGSCSRVVNLAGLSFCDSVFDTVKLLMFNQGLSHICLYLVKFCFIAFYRRDRLFLVTANVQFELNPIQVVDSLAMDSL